MGIHDRDYYREGSGGHSPFAGWSVTQGLIAANIGIFVLQHLFPLTGHLALWPAEVLRGRVWQLVTHMFCHGGVWHLLFNMLFLWWFGMELENLYGAKRYLRFYLVSGLIAGLVYVAGAVHQGTSNPAVGASGALMGVTVLYAFHYPRRRVLFYGIIPIEIRWLTLIYIVMDLSGYLNPGDHVAHAAHLGGAAYGAAYALWQRRR